MRFSLPSLSVRPHYSHRLCARIGESVVCALGGAIAGLVLAQAYLAQ